MTHITRKIILEKYIFYILFFLIIMDRRNWYWILKQFNKVIGSHTTENHFKIYILPAQRIQSGTIIEFTFTLFLAKWIRKSSIISRCLWYGLMLLSLFLPQNDIIYKEPRKNNDMTGLHSSILGSYGMYKNLSLGSSEDSYKTRPGY